MPNENTPLRLAIVGAGPVGLGLALQAAQALPTAHISLFDSRPLTKDVSADPRTLAVSLGSVQLLQRLDAWQADTAQPILEVHVSQQAPSLGGLLADVMGEPEVRISAAEEHVPMLGAVLSYGAIVAPLQAAWLAASEREPSRLITRFGTPVQAMKPLPASVEIDAGIVDSFDLAVVAEGGVFSAATPATVSTSAIARRWTR
jgi:2-octaprenyl-6-methoxyphenol hydroxylase